MATTALSPPSRGAWIEIMVGQNRSDKLESPPSRGAWIEIEIIAAVLEACDVAPLAGGVD